MHFYEQILVKSFVTIGIMNFVWCCKKCSRENRFKSTWYLAFKEGTMFVFKENSFLFPQSLTLQTAVSFKMNNQFIFYYFLLISFIYNNLYNFFDLRIFYYFHSVVFFFQKSNDLIANAIAIMIKWGYLFMIDLSFFLFFLSQTDDVVSFPLFLG